MKKRLLSIYILGLLALTYSCTLSKNSLSEKTPIDTVGIVGNQFVSYTELRDNYISGNIEKNYTDSILVEFLPIYLDYLAKILDAKALGYYDNERINNELDVYSKQAAYAFWMEKEIKPNKFKEYKARYSIELKSKHILVSVQPKASPKDTLAAYNNIMQARQEYLDGVSLEELDIKYSTKRNGRSMGGDLPWFSVGNTVPEFENALYSLDVGDISMPIRTQFGYHLIYLEEKRERKADRKLSHIFVRKNSDSTKIYNAYEALSGSVSWKNMVEKFSEDTPSIPNGGAIGWINNGSRYNSAFIDSVMNLDPTRPYSKPIETVYGYHIFKIDSIRSFRNETAEDEFIMVLLKESRSFEENNTYVINYLFDKYNARSNNSNILSYTNFISSKDTMLINEIPFPDSLSHLQVFKLNNYEFDISNFHKYLTDTYPTLLNVQYSVNWFDEFKQSQIDKNLTAITLSEYPEFENQVRNYKNGLVIYQINEDSVWSTATLDSTILKKMHSDSLHKYRFEKRFFYYMITSMHDSTLDEAITFLKEGNSADSLISKGFKVDIHSDSTDVFRGSPFNLLVDLKPGELSKRFNYSNLKGHFLLVDVLPSRRMRFDEAFNKLASDYQPIREQKWLQRIRNTYNIEQFPEIVRQQYLLEQNIE